MLREVIEISRNNKGIDVTERLNGKSVLLAAGKNDGKRLGQRPEREVINESIG